MGTTHCTANGQCRGSGIKGGADAPGDDSPLPVPGGLDGEPEGGLQSRRLEAKMAECQKLREQLQASEMAREQEHRELVELKAEVERQRTGSKTQVVALLPEQGRFTALLFGLSGGGKSHLGNLLLGIDSFEASMPHQPATTTRLCEAEDGSLVVLDCAGLGSNVLSQEAVVASVKDVSLQAPDGIDAMLFVMKNDRIDDDLIARFIFITQFLMGEACLKSLYIVITFAPHFPGDKKEADAWVKKQLDLNWRFRYIYTLVGSSTDRFIFVDNPDPASKEPHADERRCASRDAVMRALCGHPRKSLPPFCTSIMSRSRELLQNNNSGSWEARRQEFGIKEQQITQLQSQLQSLQQDLVRIRQSGQGKEQRLVVEVESCLREVSQELHRARMERRVLSDKICGTVRAQACMDPMFHQQALWQVHTAAAAFRDRFIFASAPKGTNQAFETACRRLMSLFGSLQHPPQSPHPQQQLHGHQQQLNSHHHNVAARAVHQHKAACANGHSGHHGGHHHAGQNGQISGYPPQPAPAQAHVGHRHVAEQQLQQQQHQQQQSAAMQQAAGGAPAQAQWQEAWIHQQHQQHGHAVSAQVQHGQHRMHNAGSAYMPGGCMSCSGAMPNMGTTGSDLQPAHGPAHGGQDGQLPPLPPPNHPPGQVTSLPIAGFLTKQALQEAAARRSLDREYTCGSSGVFGSENSDCFSDEGDCVEVMNGATVPKAGAIEPASGDNSVIIRADTRQSTKMPEDTWCGAWWCVELPSFLFEIVRKAPGELFYQECGMPIGKKARSAMLTPKGPTAVCGLASAPGDSQGCYFEMRFEGWNNHPAQHLIHLFINEQPRITVRRMLQEKHPEALPAPPKQFDEESRAQATATCPATPGRDQLPATFSRQVSPTKSNGPLQMLASAFKSESGDAGQTLLQQGQIFAPNCGQQLPQQFHHTHLHHHYHHHQKQHAGPQQAHPGWAHRSQSQHALGPQPTIYERSDSGVSGVSGASLA